LLFDHRTALDVYTAALHAFESTEDDHAVAKTLRAISFIHDTSGNFSRARLPVPGHSSSTSATATKTAGGDAAHDRPRIRGPAIPAAGLEFYRKSLALCTRPATRSNG
jgi:hypothetical protein